MNKKLINAVIKQSGGKSYFMEHAPDIVSHGAAGGFYGFISYFDTVAFTNKNLNLILELAEEQADGFGYTDGFELIADFTCLKDYTAGEVARAIYFKKDENECDVKNALAWYALEQVARELTEDA